MLFMKSRSTRGCGKNQSGEGKPKMRIEIREHFFKYDRCNKYTIYIRVTLMIIISHIKISSP